jgi:hypothetical protein
VKAIERILPEINEIYRIGNNHKDLIDIHELGTVKTKDGSYPIIALTIGSKDKTKPTLGLFGGVHGLERIGTQVLLSFLNTLDKRFEWDEDFKDELKTRRIVCLPIVNPWGMAHFHRSNPNGVDLMRNAPVDAEDGATFLVGGHRISNKLPWFRGKPGEAMEFEAKTLVDFVEDQMFQSRTSIALDFHSGFGTKDQIWYPFAKCKNDFPFLKSFKSLFGLFVETFPHHVYKIEPQSAVYNTHGDLWDFALINQQKSQYKDNTFIPITLELGSWNWVKKNPLQIFSMFGLFNPIKKHRYSRTMRRHIYLIDFLLRALRNDRYWVQKEK